MDDPFERLREAIAANQRRTDEVADGLQELRGEVTELRGEVREHRHHTDEVARDLRAYTDEKFEENRRHFLVLAEDLRSDLRLLAEGYVTVRDGLEALRREMAQGFDEVKSLFQVAFADHERRIRALELR